MQQLGLTFDVGLFAVLWWAWLGVFCWVHLRTCGYRRINTFTFFIPLLLLTNGIFVPFTKEINPLITGFQISHFDTYWFALLIMYACMPLGIIAANLFRKESSIVRVSFENVTEVRSPYRVKLYLGIVFVISCVSLGQIYLQGIQFDLAAYVTGQMDYAEYAAHRYGFALATAGFDYYLYNKLPYCIAPLAMILVSNMQGLATWQRYAFLGGLSFALVQTGHKLPLMTVAAYIVISRAAILRRLRLTHKLAIGIVGLFIFTVLVVLPGFYLLQGEENYLFALLWSLIRTFGEPARTLQLYFEVYPQYHGFLYGTSSRIIAGIAGVSNFVPPSVYIPEGVLGLTNASFPSLFIGEAWADFGYWGVALSSMAVGFVLQMYNVWYFSSQRPWLEETALFLSIVMGSIHLLESNFFTSLLTYGLAVNFIIYMLIRGDARRSRESPMAIRVPDVTQPL